MTTKPKKKQKTDTVFVAVKIPRDLANEIDRLVARDDTDKSKFVRSAVREKVARLKTA